MVAMDAATLYMSGLPADATYRELENSVRFLPGYDSYERDGSAAMWVTFQSLEIARQHIISFNGVPYDTKRPDVVMRINLVSSGKRASSDINAVVCETDGVCIEGINRLPPSVPYVAKPATTPGLQRSAPKIDNIFVSKGRDCYPPESRIPRSLSHRELDPDGPNAIDTIVLHGVTASHNGLTETHLEEQFSAMPGFICWRPNRKVGGGLVKFQSHQAAKDAILAAKQSGISANIAKTSLDLMREQCSTSELPEKRGAKNDSTLGPLQRMPVTSSSGADSCLRNGYGMQCSGAPSARSDLSSLRSMLMVTHEPIEARVSPRFSPAPRLI